MRLTRRRSWSAARTSLLTLAGMVLAALASAQERQVAQVVPPGGDFAATIQIVNVGSKDVDVTVTPFDTKGKPDADQEHTVPAGQVLALQNLPDGFEGGAVISSDVALPVIVTTVGTQGGATKHRAYRAVPQEPDTRPEATIFFPIRQGQGASTSYVVSNVGAGSCAERFVYVAGDGEVFPEQTLQLGPGKAVTTSHTNLFPSTAQAPDPGGAVGGQVCQWVGSAIVTNTDGQVSVASPSLARDLSATIALPYVPASSVATSTHGMLNPNGAPTNLTITFYNERGKAQQSLNTTVGRDKSLEGLLDRDFGETTSALITATNPLLARTEFTMVDGARSEGDFYAAVPGVGAGRAIATLGVAFGAELSGSTEVELRAVNMGETSGKIEVTIYDADGKRVQKKKVKVKRNGTGILAYPAKAAGPGTYARVKVLNGGPFAVGLLESWNSGELVYYPGWKINADGSVDTSDEDDDE